MLNDVENVNPFIEKASGVSMTKMGTSVAGGLMMSSPLLAKENKTYNSDKEGLYWFQKPLRIMHTVLREIDAKTYDANKVIDYLKKGSYNTLCVNAGGIVDFFQNPLPAGNVNQFMGSRDILKEISTACKKEGIRVIARIDFRGSEEHIFKKFPDWYKLDADKTPHILNWVKPQLYESCYLGNHRNEYANEFVSYVLKNYDIDGIWHNAPGYAGICYCKRCTQSYLEKTGKQLPVRAISSDADLAQYSDWKRQAADTYMNKLKQTIKSFGKDKVYTAEIFSIYGLGTEADWGIDFKNARDHFDILVSVAFLTGHGVEKYYYELDYGSSIIKFLKAMVPDKEAVVMYGGNGTAHRLVIDQKVELKIWLWQILSAGGRFWNCYFSNVPTLTHDNRNAFNETEAYQFVKANEKLLEQQIPVANIGIYYSRPTRMSYHKKSEEDTKFGAELKGIESVLMESHLPNDFLLDDQISEERLSRYKLLILPNVKLLSDKEITLLKDFVYKGGNLIATYETSLFDTDGKERINYGLSELFGVNYTGKKVNARRDSFQYILDKDHPVTKPDSDQTELLFNAGYMSLCKPSASSKVICTWVPAIHNQPPDKSWVEKFSTEFPSVVENKYGKGKVLYFSGQPDLMSYVQGHQDPRNQLERAIRYLAADSIPIESNAPPSVNIGLTQSITEPGSYILSLVNLTSGPIRPIRELIPVSDINVKLKLEGKSVRSYKILKSQGKSNVKNNQSGIELNLSNLDDFFAMHIQMNP